MGDQVKIWVGSVGPFLTDTDQVNASGEPNWALRMDVSPQNNPDVVNLEYLNQRLFTQELSSVEPPDLTDVSCSGGPGSIVFAFNTVDSSEINYGLDKHAWYVYDDGAGGFKDFITDASYFVRPASGICSPGMWVAIGGRYTASDALFALRGGFNVPNASLEQAALTLGGYWDPDAGDETTRWLSLRRHHSYGAGAAEPLKYGLAYAETANEKGLYLVECSDETSTPPVWTERIVVLDRRVDDASGSSSTTHAGATYYGVGIGLVPGPNLGLNVLKNARFESHLGDEILEIRGAGNATLDIRPNSAAADADRWRLVAGTGQDLFLQHDDGAGLVNQAAWLGSKRFTVGAGTTFSDLSQLYVYSDAADLRGVMVKNAASDGAAVFEAVVGDANRNVRIGAYGVDASVPNWAIMGANDSFSNLALGFVGEDFSSLVISGTGASYPKHAISLYGNVIKFTPDRDTTAGATASWAGGLRYNISDEVHEVWDTTEATWSQLQTEFSGYWQPNFAGDIYSDTGVGIGDLDYAATCYRDLYIHRTTGTGAMGLEIEGGSGATNERVEVLLASDYGTYKWLQMGVYGDNYTTYHNNAYICAYPASGANGLDNLGFGFWTTPNDYTGCSMVITKDHLIQVKDSIAMQSGEYVGLTSSARISFDSDNVRIVGDCYLFVEAYSPTGQFGGRVRLEGAKIADGASADFGNWEMRTYARVFNFLASDSGGTTTFRTYNDVGTMEIRLVGKTAINLASGTAAAESVDMDGNIQQTDGDWIGTGDAADTEPRLLWRANPSNRIDFYDVNTIWQRADTSQEAAYIFQADDGNYRTKLVQTTSTSLAFRIQPRDSGGTYRTAITVDTSSTTPRFSVFGVTPQQRYTLPAALSGSTYGATAETLINELRNALIGFGFCS